MRVLHIYKDYYPILGGIENHLRMLATGQVKRGLDVTVLVTHPANGADISDFEGVHLIRARRLTTTSSTPLSFDLTAQVARLQADVTHLHFPYPPGEVANLLFGRGRKTVITYHSDIIRQRQLLRFYRPLLLTVLRRADRILATSPQYVRSSPFLSQVRDKCEIVPLGIPLEPFANVDTAQVERLRAQYPGPLLLFLGKLRYYKGVNYLIEAMRDVDATLLVVGAGPMESAWRDQAQKASWGQRIIFCGEVDTEQLPAYYRAADIFVLPASERSEAFGTVQIEAMAAGCPVICTELGTGTSFVNQDGVTGLVVPPKDPASLAAAINRLLGDDALRRRMGKTGQARALTEFGEDTMVDRVIRVYRSLLPDYKS